MVRAATRVLGLLREEVLEEHLARVLDRQCVRDAREHRGDVGAGRGAREGKVARGRGQVGVCWEKGEGAGGVKGDVEVGWGLGGAER